MDGGVVSDGASQIRTRDTKSAEPFCAQDGALDQGKRVGSRRFRDFVGEIVYSGEEVSAGNSFVSKLRRLGITLVVKTTTGPGDGPSWRTWAKQDPFRVKARTADAAQRSPQQEPKWLGDTTMRSRPHRP